MTIFRSKSKPAAGRQGTAEFTCVETDWTTREKRFVCRTARLESAPSTREKLAFHETLVALRGFNGFAVGLPRAGESRQTENEVEQWVSFQAGDTLILPPGKVHQIFSDTESESIAAMPRRSTIRTPSGEVMELPWRK